MRPVYVWMLFLEEREREREQFRYSYWVIMTAFFLLVTVLYLNKTESIRFLVQWLWQQSGLWSHFHKRPIILVWAWWLLLIWFFVTTWKLNKIMKFVPFNLQKIMKCTCSLPTMRRILVLLHWILEYVKWRRTCVFNTDVVQDGWHSHHLLIFVSFQFMEC